MFKIFIFHTQLKTNITVFLLQILQNDFFFFLFTEHLKKIFIRSKKENI